MAVSNMRSVLEIAGILGVPSGWVKRALRSGAVKADQLNQWVRFDPEDAPIWRQAMFDVELAHMPTDDGLVYFIAPAKKGIGQRITGPIKIGVSIDPKKRLDALQTSSPVLLCIIATMPGGSRKETELHHTFARDRLHGEWFAPSDELSMVISAALLSERCPEPEIEVTSETEEMAQ